MHEKVWELTFVVWNYVRGDKNVKIFKNYKFYHNMTQVIVKLYENVKQRYKKKKKKETKTVGWKKCNFGLEKVGNFVKIELLEFWAYQNK